MKTVTYDPERWQLVPRVATVDMMNALVASEDNGYTVQRMYQHTIAAAPQHPDTNVYQSTDELVDPLESRDFYKMLQVYRHADICNARDAFEAVKEWLRNPTYEWGDK